MPGVPATAQNPQDVPRPPRKERRRAVALLRRGLTNAEVARRLHLPESTVRLWRQEEGLPPSDARGGRPPKVQRRRGRTVYLTLPLSDALARRAEAEGTTVPALVDRILRRAVGLPASR